MQASVIDDFRSAIAQRLRSDHSLLAARWLDRLSNLLPVDVRDVFPTDTLLDHIPELIVDIADYVAMPEREAISANTSVLLKAQDLGALRHAQRASVHQIMREYRILDGIVLTFVEQQALDWGTSASSSHVVAVTGDLHEAISVLQEATVSSFIARYVEEVNEQSERLSTFNRMVSHELRQPMGTLQFALRLLKAREQEPIDSERGRLLALVERNVDRAVHLTDRLARLSGLAGGEDDVHLQHVSVTTVAREVARQLRDMAEARGVTIDVDDDLPSTLVDVAALELALMNLVSNAVKYSDPQKPSRFVRVAAGAPVQGYCVVDVADNGLGIPAAHLGDMLERAVRAHAHRDAELGVEGLGLGLVIVRDCLRRLKGRVSVTSTEGAGTTFTLRFPRRAAPDRAE
jgi:signal transduction histidine kinase